MFGSYRCVSLLLRTCLEYLEHHVFLFHLQVGGDDGAYFISERLKERKVKLEFLLDEGMTIISGIITGTRIPVAL